MRNPTNRRLRLIGAGLVLALGGIGAQAYRLQVVEHAHLSRLSQEQYLAHVKIPARRGHIVDQTGAPLAITTDVPSVFANPSAIVDVPATVAALAPVLEMSPQALEARLTGGRYFVWLKRHVADTVGDGVRALKLIGVGVTQEPRRAYPNKEVAAPVIGMAGLDGRGLEGIEKQLDHELLGAPQMVRALRDARGRSVLSGASQQELKSRGAEVTLTLDLQVQHMAEQALAQAVATTHAQGATAVVLDVHTSEILAMAMAPAEVSQGSSSQGPQWLRNRAITDMLEPGSTLKPLVVAAALDAGAVTPYTKVFCENGRLAFKGHTISDTSPHGNLTLTEVIAKSSNIGMAKVSALLGKQNLEFALRRLGFGKKTGVEFPGESAGMLRASGSWSELEGATIAFGQGMASTLLQLAAAYRVLAADGIYREPRLLRQILRADGSVLPLPPPVERPVMSMDAARRVTRMLEAAITPVGGTGRLAAVSGYRVAGKTGTAQKADLLKRGYSSDKYVALFAGYLPAEAPRVVIVVAVDEPKTNHYGGTVAAPVFAQIGAATMQRLGVLASAGVTQPPVGPAETAALRNAPPTLAGVAPSVPQQPPEPVEHTFVGPPMETLGSVPSFLGRSARHAVQLFVEHHLPGELHITGLGRVVQQDPAPGTALDGLHQLQLTLQPL